MFGQAKLSQLRSLGIVLVAGASIGAGLLTLHTGSKSVQGKAEPAMARVERATALGGVEDFVRGQVTAQILKEAVFKASTLPAGDVRVVIRHQVFPPGFNLKHVHGGPAFAYVISGSITITDNDGTVATYNAGDYIAEPPAHIHTATSPGGAELSSLYILPDGADVTIPVP